MIVFLHAIYDFFGLCFIKVDYKSILHDFYVHAKLFTVLPGLPTVLDAPCCYFVKKNLNKQFCVYAL